MAVPTAFSQRGTTSNTANYAMAASEN